MNRSPLIIASLALASNVLGAAEFQGSMIYLPKDASPGLLQAAADLREYVQKLTGDTLEVVQTADAAKISNNAPAFVLGKPARELGLSVPETEYGVDGFAYDVSGKLVRMAGESDAATHYAVADFLERQGVRWFTPGRFGEDVPRRAALWLPDAPVSEIPSFLIRNPWYNGGQPAGNTAEDKRQFDLWCLRNKVGGGLILDTGHAWESVLAASGGRAKLFEAHPDWFGMVDGKRVPGQLNLTHPEVVDLFVNYYKQQLAGQPRDVQTLMSISPDDGVVRDESPSSRPWIFRNDVTFPNLPDVSDLLLQFCSAVQEKVSAVYPNVKLGVYIYSNHQSAPRQARLSPNLLPVFAPLNFDRYHAVGDPRSPTRRMLGGIVDQVAEQVAAFGWYDYSYLCPDALMPFTRLHMVGHDLPRLYAKGCRYYAIETAKNWPNYLPDYYLMAKLLWNVNAGQSELLDDFYSRYFGPAGPAMRAYLEELGAAYEAVPFSAGNKEFVAAVFTPQRLASLRKSMNDAVERVKSDPIRAHRVGLFERVLAQGERFMKMRDAINRFEFADADRFNQEILQAWDEALAYDPLTTSEFVKKAWYRPYYGNHVESVAGWMHNSTLLHRFPDEWPAYFDFTDTGELEGATSDETPLFNFLKLKTYSSCLAAQGWERYRGPIWYRQTFPHVSAPSGRKLALLIAGADSQTRVWVDGRLVGEQDAGSFDPMLFELPELYPKRPVHTVTIRIVNHSKGGAATELGTGGLLRPVAIIAR